MANLSQIELNNTVYDLVAKPIMPVATIDDSSTSTVFTATVPGVSTLTNGVCFFLTNNVVASSSGCTLNVNNLGAKPLYNALGDRVTGALSKGRVFLIWYDEDFHTDGCWRLGAVSDQNSTYSVITVAEINAGTASTSRAITATRLKYAIETWSPKIYLSTTEPTNSKESDIWFKIVS